MFKRVSPDRTCGTFVIALFLSLLAATGCQQQPSTADSSAPQAGEESAAEETPADESVAPADETAAGDESAPPEASVELTPEQQAAADHRREMLKQPFDLKLQLDDTQVRIIDAREAELLEEPRVLGALHVDPGRWRAKSLEPGGLEDKAFWAAEIGKLGISNSMQVVVYAENVTNAARVWWTLKYLGLTHVALLDGGWQAWQAAGYPTAAEPPLIEPKEFEPQFQSDRLVQLAEMLKVYDNDQVTVLDTRSRGEYSGAVLKGTRPGRIPGAVHLEWSELLAESGRFKSEEDLKSLFADRGILPGKTVITHCASGGRAAVEAFALELVGYPRVKNYYCGWHEWSAQEKTPVDADETPPEAEPK